MKIKILFESSTPIPVKRYGGTERVIFWHMKELVRQGHEVTLIGPPSCEVESHGIKLIACERWQNWRNLIPAGIEMVHLSATPGADLGVPFIVTIHGNGRPGEIFHNNTVFVSKKHAQNHGGDVYVYNGIDLEEYPFQPRATRHWDRFLFLAKAKWKVKNLRDCVRACRKAGKHLDVAGGRAWCFSRLIHDHGMVDQDKKLELLRQSDALLFPVRWQEPFGLAIIEAMAMGLPVIGSPYGSLPEIITAQTGVICRNFEEFSDVIARGQNRFDPVAIRRYVDENFAVKRMSSRYLELYQQVLEGRPIHAIQPITQECLVSKLIF